MWSGWRWGKGAGRDRVAQAPLQPDAQAHECAPDLPLRRVQAYHFLLLAQRQLYAAWWVGFMVVWREGGGLAEVGGGGFL